MTAPLTFLTCAPVTRCGIPSGHHNGLRLRRASGADDDAPVDEVVRRLHFSLVGNMNRLPLSVFAACLMRSLALGTPSRPCVRGVFCGPAFPLACRLPSTPSAGVVRIPLGAVGFTWLSPAFPPSCPFRSAMVLASASFAFVQKSRRYYAAVRLPAPCISGSRPWTSHCGPRRHPPRAVCRVSRFSRMVLPRMLGVST